MYEDHIVILGYQLDSFSMLFVVSLLCLFHTIYIVEL